MLLINSPKFLATISQSGRNSNVAPWLHYCSSSRARGRKSVLAIISQYLPGFASGGSQHCASPRAYLFCISSNSGEFPPNTRRAHAASGVRHLETCGKVGQKAKPLGGSVMLRVGSFHDVSPMLLPDGLPPRTMGICKGPRHYHGWHDEP